MPGICYIINIAEKNKIKSRPVRQAGRKKEALKIRRNIIYDGKGVCG